MTKRITAGTLTPYQIITSPISDKVYKEVKETLKRNTKQALKRKIMDDLKWDLHVRYANDFKVEHIEPAKEYIDKYKIENFYRKVDSENELSRKI